MWFLGLDLAQTSDFSAMVAVEQVTMRTGERVPVPTNPWARAWEPRLPAYSAIVDETTSAYHLRFLQRAPLGTPYTRIVEWVALVLHDLRQQAEEDSLPWAPRPLGAAQRREYHHAAPTLVIDQTGVGRPVIDLLREANLPATIVPVTITGGDDVTGNSSGYRVPKRDLVSAIQVLLQQRRLRWASSLAGADDLAQELASFRISISETAHDSYGARSGAHDDLVLALSLAVWAAEHGIGPLKPLYGWESWARVGRREALRWQRARRNARR